jgi:hypothetical protein
LPVALDRDMGAFGRHLVHELVKLIARLVERDDSGIGPGCRHGDSLLG